MKPRLSPTRITALLAVWLAWMILASGSSATAFARNYDGSGRLYVAKVMPAALAAATTFAYDTPGHVHDAPGHLLLPITGASNGWGSPTAAVAVSTGLPTSSYTIVRNSYGELVTMSRG